MSFAILNPQLKNIYLLFQLFVGYNSFYQGEIDILLLWEALLIMLFTEPWKKGLNTHFI